jgi:hypothetical protein
MDEKQKKWAKRGAAALAGAALLAGILAYFNRDECERVYSRISRHAVAEQKANSDKNYQQYRESNQTAEGTFENREYFPSSNGLVAVVQEEPFAIKKGLEQGIRKNNPVEKRTENAQERYGKEKAKDRGINPLEKTPYSPKEKINAGNIRRKGVEQYPRLGENGDIITEILCDGKDSIAQASQEPKLVENNQFWFEYRRIYFNYGEPAGKEKGLGRFDENGRLVLEDRVLYEVWAYYETSDEEKGGLKKVKKIVFDGNPTQIKVWKYENGESEFTTEDEMEARYVREVYKNGKRL